MTNIGTNELSLPINVFGPTTRDFSNKLKDRIINGGVGISNTCTIMIAKLLGHLMKYINCVSFTFFSSLND